MPLSCANKIREILEVADKLVGDGYINEWERGFCVSNAARAEKNFTEKQKKILSEIYEKVCKSPY